MNEWNLIIKKCVANIAGIARTDFFIMLILNGLNWFCRDLEDSPDNSVLVELKEQRDVLEKLEDQEDPVAQDQQVHRETMEPLDYVVPWVPQENQEVQELMALL